MASGSVAFVLHAHLPFVRHPAHEDFLEERWLDEAITETYIPLLEMLDSLDRDRVRARLTISLSPPLLAMLADPLLRGRYLRHLDRLVELAEKEERRTRPDPAFHRVAEMYLGRFWRARTLFLDEWQQDLVSAFRAYQERGLVEVITCAATHGFLPLLGVTAGAARTQIEVGVAEYRRFFGRGPEGFWLPECAYEPGLDAELARVGIRYFFVDTHGLAHATPTARSRCGAPRRGTRATSGTATSTATSASTSTTTTSAPTCRRPDSASTRASSTIASPARPITRSPTSPIAPATGSSPTPRTSSRRAPARCSGSRARWTGRRSSSVRTTPSCSATGGSRGQPGSSSCCAGSPSIRRSTRRRPAITSSAIPSCSRPSRPPRR